MEMFENDLHLTALFVSCGCCNKEPQMWWLKITEINSLTVLGARGQNQG